MELHYGGPVSGARRFPRPDLEAKILHFIETGAGVKMFGLRRIGKSTLRKFAAETLPEKGYSVVEVDAQGMRSIDNLLFGVFNALPTGNLTVLENLHARIFQDKTIPHIMEEAINLLRKGQATPETKRAIADYWPLISTKIVQMLKEEKRRLILCVDELPFLLENMIRDNPESGPQEVDSLLAALREWRANGLKMIVAGSIGVTGLARQYKFRSDHLNDLSMLDIPELTEPEAREFVRAVTRDCSKWTEAHTEALFQELDALYPCFLVKALQSLCHTDPPQPETFVDVFANNIRPELHSAFLTQFDRRYRIYAAIEKDYRRKLIQPILDAVLSEKTGFQQANFKIPEPYDQIDLRDAVDLLREDGFLVFKEDRDGNRTWMPASRLVRLWGRNSI